MATPTPSLQVTTRVPLDIGAIHFIGIGGIGMSGIAEVLRNLGYRVQGSDQADGANVQRLREKGVKVESLVIADDIHDFLRFHSWQIVGAAVTDYLEKMLRPRQ